jgi:hypothetical protein
LRALGKREEAEKAAKRTEIDRCLAEARAAAGIVVKEEKKGEESESEDDDWEKLREQFPQC